MCCDEAPERRRGNDYTRAIAGDNARAAPCKQHWIALLIDRTPLSRSPNVIPYTPAVMPRTRPAAAHPTCHAARPTCHAARSRSIQKQPWNDLTPSVLDSATGARNDKAGRGHRGSPGEFERAGRSAWRPRPFNGPLAWGGHSPIHCGPGGPPVCCRAGRWPARLSPFVR